MAKDTVTMSNDQFSIDSREDGKTCIEFCRKERDLEYFLYNNVETEALRPHSWGRECMCENVDHVRSFRLKTRYRKKTSEGCEKYDLYISCEPSNYILEKFECEVEGMFTRYDHNKSEKNGWKYLTTLLHLRDSCDDGFRLNLNLYTTYLKPKVTAIPNHNLFKDLSQIFTEGIYSDMTVSSDDGVTIKAHRAILARRSKVFCAALEHKEMNQNNITTPFKEEVLKQILSYIYTYETPKKGDITADLFMAADYYELPDLKSDCMALFCKQLNLNNAIETLQLAEQLSLDFLRKYTLSYIKRHFKSFKDTEDWKNIESVALMRMISEFALGGDS